MNPIHERGASASTDVKEVPRPVVWVTEERGETLETFNRVFQVQEPKWIGWNAEEREIKKLELLGRC